MIRTARVDHAQKQEADAVDVTLCDGPARISYSIINGLVFLYAKSKDGAASQRIVLMPEEMDRLVKDYRRRDA